MRIIPTLFLLSALICQGITAQTNLKPFIGVDSLPDAATPICPIPLYLGSFDDSGLQEGDTIPDFQLFSPDGTPFHIATALALGKPVLLVNGSYTCPVFRGKVPGLNQLVANYSNEVTICVIYTVEAHPDVDISPYFGYVNTGSANVNAGILYQQPTTYGQRLEVVADMLSEMNIDAPLYVDGPCNNWWTVFGPAPNNAYLISTEGLVVAKHGWFNRSPDDMACDIENYLNGTTNCGSTGGGTGVFSFKFVGDTIARGLPGEVLYVEALLENMSTSPVNIEVRRLIENLPADWTSSMCIDICYATTVDYTTIQVPAGESQLFIMDFFTDPHTIGTGMVQIGFRNMDDLTNKYTRRMYGTTEVLSAVLPESQEEFSALVYPQPARDFAMIKLPEAFLDTDGACLLHLFDQNGKQLLQMPVNKRLVRVQRGSLPAGLYHFQLEGAGRNLGFGKLVFY